VSAISLVPKYNWGATLGWVYDGNTLDGAYVFQTNPVLAGLKTILNLHASSFGRNESLGINIQPSRRWQVGAAYETQTHLDTHGSASGNASNQFAALGLAAPAGFFIRPSSPQNYPVPPPSTLHGKPLQGQRSPQS
jgi:hypothetical protein